MLKIVEWRAVRIHAGVLLLAGLLVLLLVVAAIAITIGAAGIPLARLPAALGLSAALGDSAFTARDALVLWSVRLPRIVMAALIGLLLAASGTIMQGLFRNPLADPALVGVASGGALAAAAALVARDRLLPGLPSDVATYVTPAAAFIGSLMTTVVLHCIATWRNRTSTAVFLLGGLAIAALANAGLGLLIFVADDKQLRDITFWMLGSIGGATWSKVSLLAPFAIALLVAVPFIARGLDLLALGETEAFQMGVEVERLKRISIVLVSAMTGAAVSFAGVIGFIGIIVPHLIRLLLGPSHGGLLPASALFGAVLLLVADTVARTIAAPAEVPIGILTALVGAPFFLFLLLRQRGLAGL